MQYPADLDEWLNEHDGEDPEIHTEDGNHFLVVPFSDEDGAADAVTYELQDVSGTVAHVGGE